MTYVFKTLYLRVKALTQLSFFLYKIKKGSVRPDGISVRVVPLDMPWKGHQPMGFLFFICDLEYFIRVQSSEPPHAKMTPTICLFGSRFACDQTAIFSAELVLKNAGETSIILWNTASAERIPSSRDPNQNRAALWQRRVPQ